MKRIADGSTYNTDSATKIAVFTRRLKLHSRLYEEALFAAASGELFVHNCILYGNRQGVAEYRS
jgi:hypothetical protein